MLSKTAVKYIQSLSVKKLRSESNHFIAEGPKIVHEILEGFSTNIVNIFALEEYVKTHKNILHKTNIQPTIISPVDLSKISGLKTPNQVVAIVKKKEQQPFLPPTDNITLVLEGIGDPGNMGTIIRIADWFGIQHILCSEDCVDVYNPKVVQSSMASIMRVNITITDIIRSLMENNMVDRYAAVLNGTNVYSIGKVKKGFLIIGNESRGLSEGVLKQVSEKITIPKVGEAESLNAAVATGILLSILKGN